MKKALLFLCATAAFYQAAAQRFLSEVFPSYTETANVTYATNYSVLTGTPTSVSLLMDVYQPAGAVDTMAKRPLIIFMHEGSFLPGICVNQQPIGTRDDSAMVEICHRLARRGYVVANIDYRMGWNPAGSDVDIRRGTLICAVYRALQDAKACVRFFRKDAAATNTYKIDSNKIILGGSGSGGTVAVNFACLNNPAQIAIPKYISSANEPSYGFVAGQPYVNQSVLGDFNGYGGITGINNANNSVGYGNSVQFVFSMGAVLGDSSWMTAGAPPMVAFQAVGDPGTPYKTGIVYVPPAFSVVEVSGGGVFVPTADAVGNNNCFKNAGFTDQYTVRANAANGGSEGLFPFVTNPSVVAAPWDWWDSSAVVGYAGACGVTAGAADTFMAYATSTNPNMSKVQSMAYIDTIMGYLNPRIVYCLGLSPTAVASVMLAEPGVNIYPNPTNGDFEISVTSQSAINSVAVCDITGKLIKEAVNINASNAAIQNNSLPKGMYFVTVKTDGYTITKKLIIE